MKTPKSLLSFNPADTKHTDKLKDLDADVFIANLEDGVADSDKLDARSALFNLDPGDKPLWVRINGLNSNYFLGDLNAAIACPHITTVVLPKVESSFDVKFVDRLIDLIEESGPDIGPSLRIHTIIETSPAMLQLREIIEASWRQEGLSLGLLDLAAERGIDPNFGRLDDYTLLTVRDVAASCSIPAYIAPYTDITRTHAIQDYYSRAYSFGYSGAWAIHPNQLAVIREEFTPCEAEVTRARAVIEALEGGKKGTAVADGHMVGPPHLAFAQKILDEVEE